MGSGEGTPREGISWGSGDGIGTPREGISWGSGEGIGTPREGISWGSGEGMRPRERVLVGGQERVWDPERGC